MLAIKLLVSLYVVQGLVFGQTKQSNPNNQIPSRKAKVKRITTTTELFQETTTVAPIATTAQAEIKSCAHNQSAYNKNDLKKIIQSQLPDFIHKLHASYYTNALLVRDQHLKHLNAFVNKFEERPIHLKHVLEDMAEKRQKIEPTVMRMHSALNEYESNEPRFTETFEKVHRLLDTLQRTKTICRLNCDDTHIEYRSNTESNVVIQDDFICSTFEEVSGVIDTTLETFKDEYLTRLHEKLNNDSDAFQAKIENLKNKLKEAAVQQFGMTMYEILSLQDEYFHFSEYLDDHDVTEYIYALNRNDFEINSSLVELTRMEKKYRTYCNNCNANRRVFRGLTFKASNISNNTPEEIPRKPKTILEELLDDTLKEIQFIIENHYNNIFKELYENIDGANVIDEHLAKLKPIQGEVAMDVKNEIDNLNNLTQLVPSSAIDKVLKLLMESQGLSLNLFMEIAYIKQYI